MTSAARPASIALSRASALTGVPRSRGCLTRVRSGDEAPATVQQLHARARGSAVLRGTVEASFESGGWILPEPLDVSPGDGRERNLGAARPARLRLAGHNSGANVDEAGRGRPLCDVAKEAGGRSDMCGQDCEIEGQVP